LKIINRENKVEIKKRLKDIKTYNMNLYWKTGRFFF